jgi:hypothetical protein
MTLLATSLEAGRVLFELLSTEKLGITGIMSNSASSKGVLLWPHLHAVTCRDLCILLMSWALGTLQRGRRRE